MEIGAEQFRQIVADARRQRSERKDEKRAAVRIGVRYTVNVRPIIPGINAAGTAFPAALRDISSKGVGLRCRVPIVARFTLEMADAKGAPYVVKCDVTSCHTIDKDQFLVGAVFVE